MKKDQKSQELSISYLKQGEYAKVTGFNKSEKTYRLKLLAMGLTPGTEFYLSRIAPLGDPIEIKVRGYALSLRRQEALVLQIEKIGL